MTARAKRIETLDAQLEAELAEQRRVAAARRDAYRERLRDPDVAYDLICARFDGMLDFGGDHQELYRVARESITEEQRESLVSQFRAALTAVRHA
jgi:hypothetical protein